MPSYKLVYYASRGRAEHTRLAFAYGGIPFEDVRLSGEELTKGRDEGKLHPPFAQYPYLEVDGKPLAQSGTILRYVAKKTGLYPADEFNAAIAESILDQINDISEQTYTTAFTGTGLADEATIKTFVDTKVPKLFGGIVRYLGDKKFLFGNDLTDVTFADLALYALVSSYAQYGFDYTVFVPQLKQLVANVEALPKLQAYFVQRQAVEAAEAAQQAASKST